MKDQINTGAAMARFNRAIEEADRLSGYRFDRCDPEHLVKWLVAGGRLGLAIELQSAARAAQCWQDNDLESVG